MSRRRRIASLLAIAGAITWGALDAQTNVTLTATASPAAAQPGVHLITLTGSNFPTGAIAPANVTITVMPATAGAGPSGSTTAQSVQTVIGSTRRVTFQLPSTIVVASPTPYRVSLTGATSTGVQFASAAPSALTVNPPAFVTSVSPGTGLPGQTLSVAITTAFTNFVQGSTQASFGAGVSVGGAAADGFGPVTVTSSTTATAHVAIAAGALTGSRTVTVRTGVQEAARADGFTVGQSNQPPTASAGGPYSVRLGDPVAFSASGSSDPDGDPLQYAWTFGDGATGSGVSPTHTYATPGTFTATVTVSDGRGGTHSASAQVVVRANQMPSASAGGPYSARANDPVTFSAAGSTDPDGDPLTYTWTFGDGATGTGVSPAHTYTTANTFTATVTVSDGRGGTASASAQVTVRLNQVPVASAGGPYSVGVNVPLTLTAAGSSDGDGDPLTYAWMFGDGGTGTGVSPTHSYTSAGTFTATVTVTDDHGGSASASAQVTVSAVNQAPTASAGGPYTARVNDPVPFSAAGSTDPDGDTLTYTWTFGDGGTATGVSPSHTYTTANTFTATVTVSDGRGGSQSASAQVTITAAGPSPLSLSISEPANNQAVAASPITVRGIVTDSLARVVVQNVVAAVSGNTFEARDIALSEGSNQILARATTTVGAQATATLSLTLDSLPPALTVFSPPDRALFTADSATVSAAVSDATALTCSINGAPVTIHNGLVSSPVTLVSGGNTITVSCVDAAAHVSSRMLTVYHDIAPLVVTAVAPSDGSLGIPTTATFETRFSKPVDPTTLTPSTVIVRAGNAILPVAVSLSTDRLTATATPAGPLPGGTGIVLNLTAGVRDEAGNPLAVPFVAAFTTEGVAPPPGVVIGEVYDDRRSQPLAGATVDALDKATRQVLATAVTDERGRYLVVPGHSDVVLRIGRPGYTTVERTTPESHGSFAEAMDARLTPRSAPKTIQALFGGEVTTAEGDAVVIPPGAFSANADVTLTSISGQGPAGTLPPGWTPLAIVDLDAPSGTPFQATLRLVDRSRLAGGRDAVLARYDTASAAWLAFGPVVIPAAGPLELSEPIAPGQFALLVPDQGEGAPGPALRGEPLPASAAGVIPADAQATGAVNPPVGRVDDPTPAAATVTMTGPAPLRSGTILRGDFMEVIALSRGGQVSPLDTAQDFVAYRSLADTSGQTLLADVPITASRVFNPADVTEGSITVRLSRGLPIGRTVIGASGGGVSAADGSRVIVPAGALAGDVPVELRRLDAMTFPLSAASNVTFVGALELNMSSATAAFPLVLSLSGGGSAVPTGSTVVVAEVRNVKGVERLVIVALGRVDGSDVVSVSSAGGIGMSGVRQSGRYAFYRVDGALGPVNGTARDGAGRRDGHVAELAGLPFVSITNSNGTFVLVSHPGGFDLVATAAANGDQARISGTTGTPLPEILIGPTPPRVEEITVRLAQLEGNFAGPVSLVGRPAPVVDDDSSGGSVGNGNGQIEAGEQVQVTLFVRNDGTIPIQGGSFVLAVRGPPGALQVQPAAIPLTYLPPDEPLGVGPFTFLVPAGTDPATLRYTLAYFNNGGLSNAIPFALPLSVDHPNVHASSEITIRFSEPIFESSLDGGVTLAREDGGNLVPENVAFAVAADRRSMILRSFTTLASDAIYRITLTSQVIDDDGRPLANAPHVERLRTEDRTPPPLISAGQIEASVPDGDGFVTITGSQGSVNPDDIVIGLNATTGFSVLATVSADGSFSVRVRAEATDELSLLLRDRNDNTTTVAVGALLRRDPVTGQVLAAVVGRSGGTVLTQDGIRLIVPAGAVQRGTELAAVRLTAPFELPADLQTDAAVAAAFNARFTVVDRVRITSNVSRFAGPIRLSVPVPEAAAAGDQFVVWRTRSVTFGGPVADMTRLTGIPLADNPIVTADRLEIVESATVKNEGGQLVLSTDSPPFPGITEPGDYTIARLNERLIYLAGEVRRDAVTGLLVAGVVVQSLPGAPVTSPFAAVTDENGRFLVGDGMLTGTFESGAVLSTRLDTFDHEFSRVIRRDVRGTVGPPAPQGVIVAHLAEPFVLPTRLPPEITDMLGDLDPPTVRLLIEGPTFDQEFSAVGSPLTVTVEAEDNDQVTFVGLEIDQGQGLFPVPLSPGSTFEVRPLTSGLLTLRARATDRSDNNTFVDAFVRVVSDGGSGGVSLCDFDDPACVSQDPVRPPALLTRGAARCFPAFDGALALQFSEPIARSTITPQNVHVIDPDGVEVQYTVAFERRDSRLLLTPARYLRLGATYQVVLTTAIIDLDGQAFAGHSSSCQVPSPELLTVIGHDDGQNPARADVVAISGETVADVATVGDTLVAVTQPIGSSGNRGRLHTFQLQFGPDGTFDRIDTLATVPVSGRPQSLATTGTTAYVGNRWLGAIATKSPFVSPVVVGAEPLVFPQTMLGCGLQDVTGLAPSVGTICVGLSLYWDAFPQPPSNLEVFDLEDVRDPIRLGANVINHVSDDLWDPNTFPNRVELTAQGVAVHNFLNNVEFFSPDAMPTSLGVIGQVRRYGEVTPRGPDGRLGTADDLENEFLDAVFFDGFVVTQVRDGLRIMATQPLAAVENSTQRAFIPLAGTHGGRLGAVARFQWGGVDGVDYIGDLAFVTTTDNTLRIYDVTNSALPVPMGTLANVFGNLSFDQCRGVAYVHGRLGQLHIVDFNNPNEPVELNRPDRAIEDFTVQTSAGRAWLGRHGSLNGNANRNGSIYLANDDGISAVRLRLARPPRYPRRDACVSVDLHTDIDDDGDVDLLDNLLEDKAIADIERGQVPPLNRQELIRIDDNDDGLTPRDGNSFEDDRQSVAVNLDAHGLRRGRVWLSYDETKLTVERQTTTGWVVERPGTEDQPNWDLSQDSVPSRLGVKAKQATDPNTPTILSLSLRAGDRLIEDKIPVTVADEVGEAGYFAHIRDYLAENGRACGPGQPPPCGYAVYVDDNVATPLPGGGTLANAFRLVAVRRSAVIMKVHDALTDGDKSIRAVIDRFRQGGAAHLNNDALIIVNGTFFEDLPGSGFGPRTRGQVIDARQVLPIAGPSEIPHVTGWLAQTQAGGWQFGDPTPQSAQEPSPAGLFSAMGGLAAIHPAYTDAAGSIQGVIENADRWSRALEWDIRPTNFVGWDDDTDIIFVLTKKGGGNFQSPIDLVAFMQNVVRSGADMIRGLDGGTSVALAHADRQGRGLQVAEENFRHTSPVDVPRRVNNYLLLLPATQPSH